jgi:hypothetical protein
MRRTALSHVLAACLVAALVLGCSTPYDPALETRWVDDHALEMGLDRTVPYTSGGAIHLRVYGCAPEGLISTSVVVRDLSQVTDAGPVATWSALALMSDPDTACSAATPNRLVADVTIQHPAGGQFEIDVGAFGILVRRTVPLAERVPPPAQLLIEVGAGSPTAYPATGGVVTPTFRVTRGGVPAEGVMVTFTSTLPTPPTPTMAATDASGGVSTSLYAPSDMSQVLLRAVSGSASATTTLGRAAM